MIAYTRDYRFFAVSIGMILNLVLLSDIVRRFGFLVVRTCKRLELCDDLPQAREMLQGLLDILVFRSLDFPDFRGMIPVVFCSRFVGYDLALGCDCDCFNFSVDCPDLIAFLEFGFVLVFHLVFSFLFLFLVS